MFTINLEDGRKAPSKASYTRKDNLSLKYQRSTLSSLQKHKA